MLSHYAALSLITAIAGADVGPQMQIIAHEDDDLLFINPAVSQAIGAGREVVSVYLTAGDDGRGAVYWQGRQAGIRAAYAAMAGAPDVWERGEVRGDTAWFDAYTLARGPRVAVLFLHLPDGGDGTGSAVFPGKSLGLLWRGLIPQLDSVDGRQSLGRAPLIDALAALITLFEPADITLLDCTGLNGWDHSDHFYSAMFGLAAANRAGSPARIGLHRTYNIDGLPENLGPGDRTHKERAVRAYIPFDPVLCPADRPCVPNALYAKWITRTYRLPGAVIEGAHSCMAPAP